MYRIQYFTKYFKTYELRNILMNKSNENSQMREETKEKEPTKIELKQMVHYMIDIVLLKNMIFQTKTKIASFMRKAKIQQHQKTQH